MELNDAVLLEDEKIIFTLRNLYLNNGYSLYRMSKFEEYDLYAKNKDFLVSDNVITFNDVNGKLMALKPDVTLSIIKNSNDLPNETQKVFYNENVYRIPNGGNSFKENIQVGLECFGKIDEDCALEVLKLAILSMQSFTSDFYLCVSNLTIIEAYLEKMGLQGKNALKALEFVNEKNLHGLDEFLIEEGIDEEKASEFKKLISINGSLDEMIPEIKKIASGLEDESVNAFLRILENISNTEFKDKVRIDFSVVNDFNYYNGIIFKGYVEGLADTVLSGGQYDKLMSKLKRKSKAIGFAVYLDALDLLNIKDSALVENNDTMLNVALPKGRLGERVYEMFAKAGFECPSILENNRKLIFENKEKSVRYFWVKPSDVAIYVERGVADVGVCGKDILAEGRPDIYELLDMKTGKCRMCVAGSKDFEDDTERPLRVATKFTNVAEEYYQKKGRDIDIIHLNGSIEIAPILGLSDVIVDIVETGTTLKENNLSVLSEIFPISARLIANKSSFTFKKNLIEKLRDDLENIVENAE